MSILVVPSETFSRMPFRAVLHKRQDKQRELPKTAAQINWQEFHAWKKTVSV